MKVTLFDGTGMGANNPGRYAAAKLIFTKSTRLDMTPELLTKIRRWPDSEILDELKHMADTNPGSWEFIDFSFLIEGVSRAFTQQLERTRKAVYAERSLRVVDISGIFEFYTGPSIIDNHLLKESYNAHMDRTAITYKELIRLGARIEDARGVLPLNIKTNVCMKIDMRNFIYTARARVSKRVQDEYQQVVNLMIIEIEKVYPWFYIFYKKDQMQAFKDLSDMIDENKAIDTETKTQMFRLMDIIKGKM